MKKSAKISTQKKEDIQKRVDKLDPNNSKNKKENPLVKHGNKLIRDDGFEHRSSDERADKV